MWWLWNWHDDSRREAYRVDNWNDCAVAIVFGMKNKENHQIRRRKNKKKTDLFRKSSVDIFSFLFSFRLCVLRRTFVIRHRHRVISTLKRIQSFAPSQSQNPINVYLFLNGILFCILFSLLISAYFCFRVYWASKWNGKNMTRHVSK